MSPLYARKSSPATAVELPLAPDTIFARFSGVSTTREVTEWWGAEETSPGVYAATRMWRVPQPPIGVEPELEQTEISGGDVVASWINTTSEFSILVEFRINSVSWGTISRPPASTSATLPEAELSEFDVVEARMRYFEGSVEGTWSDWSDPPLTYQG